MSSPEPKQSGSRSQHALPGALPGVSQGELPPAISCSGITKKFGPTTALLDVSFESYFGQVTGLAGENGAGKSTLLDVLSGALVPDQGDVFVGGERVEFSSPKDANLHGVFRMFQNPNIVSELPVYENVYLGFHEHFSRSGFVRHSSMRQAAKQHLERIFGSLDIAARNAGDLDFASKQLIQVVRGFACAELLDIKHPIFLLDEPTAALHEEAIHRLFSLLSGIRDVASVVLVSHRLSELIEQTNRLYVLRDGSVGANLNTPDISETHLHGIMVGRVGSGASDAMRIANFYRSDLQVPPQEEVALSVRDFSLDAHFKGVNFDLRRGEILGIGGVEASGKEKVGRCIFGMMKPSGGTVQLGDRQVVPDSCRRMKRAGLGFLPVDRVGESLILNLPIATNITLAGLEQFASRTGGMIDRSRELRCARDYIERLKIKAQGPRALVSSLSGGNQQKVALAKWMVMQLPVLIVENPTQGVDVGVKHELYRVFRNLVSEGLSILLISDDLLELIGLAHRVLIMKDGVAVGEVQCPPKSKPREEDLIPLMV